MRRDQIHKICLNHTLTPEIEYKRKDDKSWLFVVGDYSEGELEVRSFCIRFKNNDIAAEFKQAVDDALGDDARIVENGHGSEEDKAMHEDEKLAEKLMLPPNYFDYKKKDDCKGCRGCKSDDYKIPDFPSPVKIETELPLDMEGIKLESKVRRGSKPKRVSFSVDDSVSGTEASNNEIKSDPKSIFSSALNTIPSSSSQTSTNKSSIFGNAGATEGGNIFGGTGFQSFGNKTSMFGGTTNASVPELKPIFGGAASAPVTKDAKTLFGGMTTTMISDTKNLFSGAGTKATPETKTLFSGSPSATPTTGPTPESKSIFGGTGTGLFSSSTFTPPSNNNSGTIFGAKSTFGSATSNNSNATPATNTTVFGSTTTSSFSFSAAAKELDKTKASDANDNAAKPDENKNSPMPDFLKSNTGPSFASVASSNNNAFSGASTGGTATGKEGFVGLTIKEDIFTKLAKQKSGDTSKDETAAGGGEDSNANDENYDPHYDPIIALPDEIQLSTGEEEETKLFGERAKLYRYSTDTREWKERGKHVYFLIGPSNSNKNRLYFRRWRTQSLTSSRTWHLQIFNASRTNP